MRHIDHEKIKRINERLNLLDLCKTGFWFCRACQHVTELDSDTRNGLGVCDICKSPNIRHHQPIEFDTPTPNVSA